MPDTDRDRSQAFIIMPITVPEHCVSLYKHSGGEEHFRHVLDSLLVPAIERIGYEPVPPKFKGTVHIQAEIVQALSLADLVVCDMSALNPNVFFELGARSALNLPVAIVVDEHHKDIVPFDLRPIGYYQYESTLHAWDHEGQVAALAQHLEDTIASGSQNALWRYFGVSATAQFNPKASTQDDKLDVIMRSVTGLLDDWKAERHEFPTHPGSDGPEPAETKAGSFVNWLLYMSGEHGGVSGLRDSLLYEAAALRLPKWSYRVVAEATDELKDEAGHVSLDALAKRLQNHPSFLKREGVGL